MVFSVELRSQNYCYGLCVYAEMRLRILDFNETLLVEMISVLIGVISNWISAVDCYSTDRGKQL